VAAAERATALLAHEEAARHLRAALSALPHGSDARRGPLHAALGEAHLRAGAAEGARRAFADAAEAARSGGDEALLARAALGAGGLGVAVREADPALVGLLGEALAAVGAGRLPLRARLLARLAVERYYGDRDGALALSAEALECAAAADDPAALAVALNARRVALWSPDRVDERLAVSTRMVELAERAGDREWVLQGRNWRVVDLLELGRVPEVEREIDRYDEDADALGLPHFRWYVPLWRGGLSILAGRFAEAGRLAGDALALGTAAGDANAALFVGIQRWHGLYEAGRESEADRTFVEAGASRPPAGWAWLPGLARIHAAAGDPEAARAALAPLAAHGFAVARLDANWHALLEAGEVAAALREPEWAARLYALLAPFAALNGVIARGVGCYGSSEYVLGLLAAATGRPAEAESHLERAVAENDRLGARPRAAQARLHLARLVLARGERARGRALAAEAARAAAAMGIETTAEAAHALRA
jgi:hypothetical protein